MLARGFRALWLAAVVSRTGDALNFVALALFVLATTGSAAAVGGVVLTEGVGLLLGALLAQLLVDHVAPRRLLVSVDLARVVPALALALAPSYPMAVAGALALALGTAFSHRPRRHCCRGCCQKSSWLRATACCGWPA